MPRGQWPTRPCDASAAGSSKLWVAAPCALAAFAAACVAAPEAQLPPVREWCEPVVPFRPSGSSWVRCYGGVGDDDAYAVALAPDGGLVVAGSYDPPWIFFDPPRFRPPLLNTGFNEDILVAKYNFDGTLAWAAESGGPHPEEEARGVAVDPFGNVYVAGHFGGNATFGIGGRRPQSLQAAGLLDVFLAKFDPFGQLLWAVAAGGPGDDEAWGVTVTSDGNVAVVGHYHVTARFGTQLLTAVGLNDMFVAKYTATGQLLWVRSAGGANDESRATGVAPLRDGGVAVSGTAAGGKITFGAGQRNAQTFALFGLEDLVVARYARDGSLLWVQHAGAANREAEAAAIATDPLGSVYLAGRFDGNAAFGLQQPAPETAVQSAGTWDALLAKLAGLTGQVLWARAAGGGASDRARDVAVDAFGNAYITGHVATHAQPPRVGPIRLAMQGSGRSRDAFVAKYDTLGNVLWAKSYGGPQDDEGMSIAVAPDGSLGVTGSFQGTARFDTLPASPLSAGPSFVAAGGMNPPEDDAFVLRMPPQ